MKIQVVLAVALITVVRFPKGVITQSIEAPPEADEIKAKLDPEPQNDDVGNGQEFTSPERAVVDRPISVHAQGSDYESLPNQSRPPPGQRPPVGQGQSDHGSLPTQSRPPPGQRPPFYPDHFVGGRPHQGQGHSRPQGSYPQGQGHPQGFYPQGQGRPQHSRPQGQVAYPSAVQVQGYPPQGYPGMYPSVPGYYPGGIVGLGGPSVLYPLYPPPGTGVVEILPVGPGGGNSVIVIPTTTIGRKTQPENQ